MTASVLKQDPNRKRFRQTLIYFNTDTQYANIRVKINKRLFERFCVWIKLFKSQVNVRNTAYMIYASYAVSPGGIFYWLQVFQSLYIFILWVPEVISPLN